MKLATLLPYVVLLAGCASQAESVWEPTTKEQILDRIAYLEVDLSITSKQIAEAEKLRAQWAIAASGSSAGLLGNNPAVSGLQQVSNAIIELQNHSHNNWREIGKLQRRLKSLQDTDETPKKATTPQ